MRKLWNILPWQVQNILIILSWLGCLQVLLSAAVLIFTGQTPDDQAVGFLLLLAGSGGAWAIYYWRLLERALTQFHPRTIWWIKLILNLRCFYGIFRAIVFTVDPRGHPTWWHFYATSAMIFILARALMWPKEE